MPDRRFLFQVDVDTAAATRAANKLQSTFQNALNKLVLPADLAGTKGGARGAAAGGGGAQGGAVDVAAKLFSANFITQSARQVFSIAQVTAELGKQGAEITRITRSYGELSAAIGINAESLSVKMRAAVQGTVTDYNMLSRANLLLASAQQGALEVNEDQIATLARFARLRSTQLTMEGKALSTEEAFSRLIRGVAKRESELLDELGISTKQMADLLGISVKEVNSSVQSMLDSVLAVAEMDLSTFGDPIMDEATKIEQAEVRITESMDLIRKALAAPTAGGMDWISRGVEDLVKSTLWRGFGQGASDEFKKNMEDAIAVTEKTADSPLTKIMEKVSPGKLSSEENLKAMREMVEVIDNVDAAITNSVPGAEALRTQLLMLGSAAGMGLLTPQMLEQWELLNIIISNTAVSAEFLNEQLARDTATDKQAAEIEKGKEQKRLLEEQAVAGTNLNNTLGAIDDAAAMGVTGLDKIRQTLIDIAEQAILTGSITAEQMANINTLTGVFYSRLPANVKPIIGPQLRTPSKQDIPTSWGGLDDFINKELGPGLKTILTGIENDRQQAAKQAASDAKSAARAAEAAFKAAAKEAAAAWKAGIASIQGIPGVSGSSKVTQEDLDRAAQGLPVDFADNFTRRMNDELINGVDYPEVSRSLVEAIVGATRGLSQGQLAGVSDEVLAGMATEDIGSGAVFATDIGKSMRDVLINKEALIKDARYQAMISLGTSYVEHYVQEVLEAAGINFGDTENPITSALIKDFQVGGKDIAGPSIDGLSNQFADGKVVLKMTAVGVSIAENLFSGFSEGITEQPWAQEMIRRVKEDIIRELSKTFVEPVS